MNDSASASRVGHRARFRFVVGDFENFAYDVTPRLRSALVAAYGYEIGIDAAADALAYGWEHWARLTEMVNPAGYLFRVGQSSARRALRSRPVRLPVPEPNTIPHFEPKLIEALIALTESQRVAVLLVHGFGWSYRDVADLLQIRTGTVKTHLDRGLSKLRRFMEVPVRAR